MKNCVVIPVYNSPYIDEVIKDALKYDYKIIVVDDGSDKKVSVPDDVILITHKQNMGKGEAILSGAKKAKELGYNFFVTMDADKQHLASEIHKLIAAYKTDSIVIGNRDFQHENVPDSSKFGRKFSNFWVKLETFKTLGDTQSGFRIYPTNILDLNIKNKRFDFEIEVLALHSYRNGNIIDVETDCYYPPSDERVTHFDKVKDNIRLSLIHTKLVIQRYLLLRGILWR
ncbi:glycosyltransferase family 2 protein [Sulfurimonas lithotrophica]|uniref:Glycosyltransferase family 2 protein n=1 Tax=Sulfurimonas lithotrophica TaxID=2590022 RepID=A0A5P8P3F0_9BACT|nr:glycosyltransferase family 2 protein [Sulfurimonas lithotrophica]QFR50186.1 glycosyltransferase family 2 protein [Sulfurimonas lithotrophica]